MSDCPRSSFSFFVNLWTTNRAFLLPGIYFKFPWSFPSVTFWFTSSYLHLDGRQHWWTLHSWGPHHDPYSYSLNSGREQFASVCTPTPAQHLSTYWKTIQFRSHPMALATPSRLFTGAVFWAFRCANIFWHCLIQDSKNPGSITLGQFWSKSCLEHPALLAGCVCVYLLKRSKTCTWSLRFPHDEHMIGFGKNFHHEEFFYLHLYIYIYSSMRFCFIYFTWMQ